MSKLFEYFSNDFKDISIDNSINVKYQKLNVETNYFYDVLLEIKQKIQQNTLNSTRFFAFYIPQTRDLFEICKKLLEGLEKWKENANDIEAIGGYSGDITIGKHIHIYSNRIYIYSETLFTTNEISELEEIANNKELFITIRSQDYIENRMKLEKPMAFISHDSRDKDLIARPLSLGLHSRLCFVWFDEFSLKVGDSLRDSIELGIKEAPRCILILTPNFLSNPGWTKKEFNSIFTREMIFNEKIVLPIWFNVTKEDVYNFSPSLADTYALIWPEMNQLSKEVYNKEVEKVISKIHTEITREKIQQISL